LGCPSNTFYDVKSAEVLYRTSKRLATTRRRREFWRHEAEGLSQRERRGTAALRKRRIVPA
jgi:hypothetical protein